MMVKFEDDPDLAAPVDIDVAALVQGSPLVSGFSHDLPSTSLIQDVIQQQQVEIAQGTLTPTGTLPGEATGSAPTDSVYQNGAAGNAVLEADCEAVGNFLLCYRPCAECTECSPLSDGGYVCRH
jgi:hypothetical protein